MLSPFILENIVNSFSFILIILVASLLALILYLLVRNSARKKEKEYTTQRIEMLDNLFDNASVPCVIIKRDGHIVLINKKALDLFGKDKEEMKDQLLDAFTLIAASKKKTDEMERMLDKNKRYDFDYTIINKDQKIPCVFHVSQLLAGNHKRYLISISEARDKLRIENEKNLLEERINNLEQSIGLGFWIYDYDLNVTFWSRGLYKLLGAEVNKVKPDLSFVSTFEGNKGQDLLLSIRNQEEYQDRVKINTYDGQERVVDLIVKHQPDLNGDMSKSMGILRDLTETLHLQNQNEQARRILDQVLNSQEICMVISDTQNNIISLNDYTLQVLDEPINQVIGYNFFDVFGRPRNIPKEFRSVKNATFETELPYKDDIILWQRMKFEMNTNEIVNLSIGVNLTASAKILEVIKKDNTNEKN